MKKRYLKNIEVEGHDYQLEISDYTLGIKGWFSVYIYEGKKKFLSSPLNMFNTFDDPIIVSTQIIERINKDNKKLTVYLYKKSADLQKNVL